MATVDSLDIQISASIENANRAINSLYNNLGNLATRLSNISSTKIKLDIDTSAVKNVDTLKYSVQKALDNVKISTSKIGDELAKSFNITGAKASQDISKQFSGIIESAVDKFDGSKLKVSGSAINELAENIAQNGKIAKGELQSALSGIESEYQDFYNYFKQHKLYISDFLKADIGKTEFADILQTNLSNITRDAIKGIDLNAYWEELTGRFPSILPQGMDNAADQVITVLQKIGEVREQIKPISMQELVGSDYDAAIQNIKDRIINSIGEAKDILLRNATEIYNAPQNAFTPSVTVNEDAIVKQIESAIRTASTVKYEPLRINLDVDTKKIKSDLTEKLKGINLSELSDTFAQFQNISFDAKPIIEMANAVSILGRKTSTVGIENIPTLTNAVRDMLSTFGQLPAIDSSIVQMTNSLATLAQKSGNLQTALREVSNAANEAKTTLADMPEPRFLDNDLSATIEDFKQRLSELDSIIEKGGWETESGIVFPTQALETSLEQLREIFPDAKELISSYEEEIRRVKELELNAPTMAVPDMSSFKTESNNVKAWIDELAQKLNNLQVPPIREDNLQKLQSSLEKTEIKLEELRAKLANGLEMGNISESIDDKGYVKLQEQIALTEKQAEALRAKIQEVEQQSKTNWAESLSNALGKVSTFAKQAHTALAKLSSVLKKINSGISKVFGKFASLGKSLTNLSKSSKKSELSLSKAFKMILRYGLGIRSVYVLINRMRRAIIEGFKNLAQYSSEVNASISTLKGSFETLKNASAAALSPLLNAIAPALNTIIQLCIRATNAINQFLSAIFGKGTWIKAKDQIVDYADSLKSASGAAEKLKTITLGIDELNINAPDDSAGGGGSSALENAEDMFETLPIESKFLELAEKVKDILSQLFDPIKSAWDNVGSDVMDAWKYALDEVWKLIKDIGRDFLEVWNQPATIKIFEDILAIIKDIGLVIGNLAKNFREAWNTNEVGLHIFENIRDIIGVIIANIRHAADATVEWSANLDFLPILEAFERFTKSLIPVADALSGILTDFYEKVLLPLGKWTLEEGLPKLLDVFTAFNEKVDWVVLRANLAEFWEHLEPFAETVGEGLIIFIERVSDLVANFVNSDTFVKFLTSIEEWMDNVAPEDVADGIEKLVKALIAFKLAVAGFSALTTISSTFTALSTAIAPLTSLFSGLGEIVLTISAPIVEMFSLWAGGAGTLGESFMAVFGAGGVITIALAALAAGLGITYAKNEEVRESFSQAISAIKDGLQPALEFVTNTLLPDLNNGWNRLMEILSPLGNFLNGMFVSIWQDMINPALTYIGQTVLPLVTEAFTNLWSNVLVPAGTFLSDVLAPIIQVVSDLLTFLWQYVVVPLADAVMNILGAQFELLCGVFSEVVIPIVNGIISVFQFLWNKVLSPIVNWLIGTFQPVFEDVFKKIKGIIDGLSKAFSGLIDFITGIFTRNWEKAWGGIKDIFKGIFNMLVSIVEGAVNIIIDGLNFFLGKFNGVVTSVGDVIGVSISIPEIPKLELPRFEKGGLTLSHTFAEISEFNKPEAILPLSDARAMSMIADSIMENANYSYSGNDADIKGMIREAVHEEVSYLVQAIAPYLWDISQNTRETADKDMSFSVDGRELVNAASEVNQSMGFNFNTGMSRGGVAF